MIKATVTAVGTITRSATVRTSKEGVTFLSFSMTVNIPSSDGHSVGMELSVSKDGDESMTADYAVGRRISVSGVLTPRKQDETLYYNLKASSCSFECPEKDSIAGDVLFRGTAGKTIQTRTDRNGKPYFTFSAYSSDKVGDNYVFIWMRFIYFSSSPAEWFQAGCGFDAAGALEVSVYKDKLDLTCRIKTLEKWEKQVHADS